MIGKQDFQGIDFPEKKEFLEQAVSSNCSMMPVNILIGGSFAVGALVSWSLSPQVGALAGGSCLVSAFILAGKIGAREDLIRKHKLIAPFLPDKRSMLEYSDLVGFEQIKWECNRARQMGEDISGAAQNYLKFAESDIQSQTQTNGHKPNGEGKEEHLLTTTNEQQQQVNANGGENNNNVPTTTDAAGEETIEDTNPFESKLILASPFKIFTGNMGSGKTTSAAALVEQHLNRGDFVVIFNPFRKASEWHGVPVAGRKPGQSARDVAYQDVQDGIQWFVSLLQGRADKQGEDETYDAKQKQRVVAVFEEVTTWSLYVEPEYFKELWALALQGLRQLNCSIILISHNVTREGLGGEKAVGGWSETLFRQADLFQFESKPNPSNDPTASATIPAGKARWKPANYPNRRDSYRKVKVPESFRPTHLNLDFRHLSKKEKHPNWRKEVGLDG